MFKVLILQASRSLSDERSEYLIWPPIARNPAAESAASKRLNRTSIAGLPRSLARVSASRKV
jgi:hypothetical protein